MRCSTRCVPSSRASAPPVCAAPLHRPSTAAVSRSRARATSYSRLLVQSDFLVLRRLRRHVRGTVLHLEIVTTNVKNKIVIYVDGTLEDAGRDFISPFRDSTAHWDITVRAITYRPLVQYVNTSFNLDAIMCQIDMHSNYSIIPI